MGLLIIAYEIAVSALVLMIIMKVHKKLIKNNKKKSVSIMTAIMFSLTTPLLSYLFIIFLGGFFFEEGIFLTIVIGGAICMVPVAIIQITFLIVQSIELYEKNIENL